MATQMVSFLGNARLGHAEPASRTQGKPVFSGDVGVLGRYWENADYYGEFAEFPTGAPFGGGRYAVVSVTATDETARHDWRDFQQLKNWLVGPEWEAVELYPAEGRLLDPSNRFYLWCFPPGVLKRLGMSGKRSVLTPAESPAPQRPFPG